MFKLVQTTILPGKEISGMRSLVYALISGLITDFCEIEGPEKGAEAFTASSEEDKQNSWRSI